MTRTSSRLMAAALFLAIPLQAAEANCRPESFEGNRYTVCSFDLTEVDLRTFWRDGSGEPYRTFSALEEELREEGRELVFAMNGGMYDDEYSPLGLYVEDGEEISPPNDKDAPQLINGQPPNFYRKPNGVFYIGEDRAGVIETGAYLQAPPDAEFATQSGPMLVIDGVIHEDFIPGSTDRKPRNGVGVASPTEVHFANSEGRVNFHDFARFFRDHLGAANALFLDGGTAPGLYSPELGRDDLPGHGGYGPIIGAVGG